MGISQSTNYSRQKAHYGGIVGTIQQNAIEGVLLDKDPTNAIFKENFPAGFLACDGRVYNVKDYYCLAQVLGIGDDCRFKKDHVTLRNPDTATGDLGSFQVPDLGSKVMVGGRATGAYDGTTKENKPNTNRVGVEVDASTNVGSRVYCNYNGHMQIEAATDIDFNGSIRYKTIRKSSAVDLSIDDFQAHAHNTTNMKMLNYTGNAAISGDGKSSAGSSSSSPFLNVNAFGGNAFDWIDDNDTDADQAHDHILDRPTEYPHNFKYSYDSTNVDLSDMRSYIDVSTTNLDVLNQVVTPFIMVHYIIKF